MSEIAAHLPWLEDFVKTKFHDPCPIHGDSKCYLCSYFCTNCRDNPFCFRCHKEDTKHKDHLVLRVRRASEHSAIEVDDINKFLDTSGIKEFSINNKKIFHLYSRQTKKHTGLSLKRCCKTCNWKLKTEDLFCSIECKLFAKQEEEMDGIQCANARMIAPKEMELPKSDELHNQEGSESDVALEGETSNKKRRSKSRKGIPHRSPFF